jgi:putative membrane protein
MYPHGGMMFHNFGSAMGGWWGLGTLLFWIAVFAFGVWTVRTLTHQNSRGSKSPRDILDERYARGELSRKEYEAMKADLNKN